MAIEIVLSSGKFTLLPIDVPVEGSTEEEGATERGGYYFRFADPESGITLVAPLPVEQARQLGQALLDDAPGSSSITVAGKDALRILDHQRRQPGRGKRR